MKLIFHYKFRIYASKLLKFAFIVTGSIFLQSYRVSDNVPYQNVPSEIISPHCIVCSSNGCGPAMDQWITLHLNGSDAQRPEAITTKAALPGQKASAFTNSPVSALWWLCTHCLVTRAERQIYIHAAPLPPPPHSWPNGKNPPEII